MSVWYRAHRSNKMAEVFSGDGGLLAAGRWNHMGNKVIYCSESIALCTLEWLCHHGLSVSGFDYYRYSIDIPDKLILKFPVEKLPKDWSQTPSTDVTRDLAEEYLFQNKKYFALAVPSVVVPEEFNLVINPLHDAFKNIYKNIQTLGKYSSPDRK
ncbi:MAG TPA: RES family NAD+ phosphorylase [Gammaproteobacteria bacterium]|jgi:RES domain-containing protein|nr:RES family NAD+ phosphorylase [Gammaproteobacteria bacterium]